TVTITIFAGVVTTLLAAIVPAVASGRVSPVAAMNDAVLEPVRSMRPRALTAAAFVAVGIASTIAVLAGADAILLGVAVV
ncbi:MAG TPA: hypothetical protein PLV68_17690, partial [Ilumatobacteraceae bacterium]|nr:hypothetical protein [Ilumatobacteraceae bacterium]